MEQDRPTYLNIGYDVWLHRERLSLPSDRDFTSALDFGLQHEGVAADNILSGNIEGGIAVEGTNAVLSDIAGNTTNITTNASGIATNVTDISGNTSSITQNATDIALRVEKNDVIHQINISTEGITIEADNLTVDSTTTFTSGWESASNVGSLAAKDSVGSTDCNTTIIDGGKIVTGLLTGATIQTATSGKRLRMQGTPANEYQFLDGSTKVGHLKIDDDGAGGYLAQIGIEHLGPVIEVGSTIGASEMVYFDAPFFSSSGRAAVGQVTLEGINSKAGLTWSGGGTATWSFDLGTNFVKMSSVIDMDSHKILNLTTPTSNYDAATKKYVDDNAGGASQLTDLSDVDSANQTNHYVLKTSGASYYGAQLNHSELTGIGSNDHHSSTSNNLTITPTKVNINDPSGTSGALNVNGNFHLYSGSFDIKNTSASIAWGGTAHIAYDSGSNSVVIHGNYTDLINSGNAGADLGSSPNHYWDHLYIKYVNVKSDGYIEGGYLSTNWIQVNKSIAGSAGNIYKTGTCEFCIDHPFKAGYNLEYAAPEAPEVALFYRGKGETKNGVKEIELPKHFAYMTPKNRSVYLTPFSNANMWIDKIKKNSVIVRSSEPHVKFSFLIMGTRRGYENFNPEVKVK